MNRYLIIGAGAIELFDGPPERLQAYSQRMLQETLAVFTAMGLGRGSSHEVDFLNDEVVLLGRLR